MVNARLCDKARPAFIFTSPRHFQFSNCETNNFSKAKMRPLRSKGDDEDMKVNIFQFMEGIKRGTLINLAVPPAVFEQ